MAGAAGAKPSILLPSDVVAGGVRTSCFFPFPLSHRLISPPGDQRAHAVSSACAGGETCGARQPPGSACEKEGEVVRTCTRGGKRWRRRRGRQGRRRGRGPPDAVDEACGVHAATSGSRQSMAASGGASPLHGRGEQVRRGSRQHVARPAGPLRSLAWQVAAPTATSSSSAWPWLASLATPTVLGTPYTSS